MTASHSTRHARTDDADLRPLACPDCGREARVPERYAGKRVRCPRCGAEFRVADDMSRLIAQVAPASKAESQATPQRRPAPSETRAGTSRRSRAVTATSTRSPSPAATSDRATSRRSRVWLVAAWGSAALATIVISALLFFGRQSKAAADEAGGDAADAQQQASAPPANQPVDKPPRPRDKSADRPKPKPLTDGDRLVQLNGFDQDKLQGLKTIMPSEALQQKTSLTGKSIPLIAALKQLAERHRMPLVIDVEALTDEGIPLEMPVDASVSGVTLKDALTAVLAPLQLTHVLPQPNAKAVVVTSQVKAAGTNVTLLLKGGLSRKRPPRTNPVSLAGVKPPTGQFTTQAIHRRGAELLKEGKLDEAIAEFSRALQQRRSYLPALFDRGSAYLRKGDYRNALRDFNRLIALDRTNGPAYASRAVANEKLGFAQQARADRFKASQIQRLADAGRKKK